MRAEEYLQQIKKLEVMIKNKTAEKKRWVSIAESCGNYTDSERVQTTGNPHKVSDAIATYIDLETEINRLKAERNEIIKTIESLPTLEYDVLHKIYVQDWSLTEIADIYDKSYSWATKVKSRALSLVQAILDA